MQKADIISDFGSIKKSIPFYYVLEGDNKKWFTILDEKFKNKVKLIYLDPPYNTKRTRGARRNYSDRNNNWSEMMRNVLQKSYDYLNDPGFLAVSINQMEMFNLKNIADEIFKDGFVGIFPIKIRHHERQLMINATFHNVFEYLLIFRKNKLSRFYSPHAPYKLEEFCWEIEILDNNPTKTTAGGKDIEIYDQNQYKVTKKEPSPELLRKYLIAGKIATANWSGEVYEAHLKKIGKDKLVKVYGLDKQGLGYRWFLTSNHNRKSGIYFQSTKTAGRPSLFTNFIDYTDIVTYIYQEGGPKCDFKDSKKPEKLINLILEMTTKENDLVMDFFGGSGTTMACCIKKKRSCIIIENGKKALDILYTRLENMKSGKDIERIKYKFNYSSASITKTLMNYIPA